MSLNICIVFFNRLSDEDVSYCHWKSNANIDKSLAGKTDFDLLVSETERKKFENILNELNFKQVLSPPEKQFPGVEDYLGFDEETGGLCHLHIHYKLLCQLLQLIFSEQ